MFKIVMIIYSFRRVFVQVEKTERIFWPPEVNRLNLQSVNKTFLNKSIFITTFTSSKEKKHQQDYVISSWFYTIYRKCLNDY